jgi:hypothetical protein
MIFGCALAGAVRAAELLVDFTSSALNKNDVVVAAVGDTISVILPLESFTGRTWSCQALRTPSIVEPIGEPVYLSSNPRPGAASGMKFKFMVTGLGSTDLLFTLPNTQNGQLHSTTLEIHAE